MAAGPRVARGRAAGRRAAAGENGTSSRRRAATARSTSTRAETLRRLEEEQREFVDYLERLRQAKDKAEFDQFMADRRRPQTPTDPSAPNT